MAEAFFYVFTFAAAVAALTVCPKTEKKMNLMVGIMTSYVTVLCIGAVGALAIHISGIPVCLPSMGVVYVLIAFGGFLISVMKRQRQRFFIRSRDVLAVFLCILIVGMISLSIFTPYLHINYANAYDPSNHYYWAMEVARDQRLSGMFFAPLYNGMFISLFQWLLPTEWTYKAFILADIFHTIMEFLFFYSVIEAITEKSKKKWKPLIISIVYWCGYPLFCFAAGGYVYWGMAAMLIEYVFLLLKWYEEKTDGKRMALCLTVTGCFAISVCYIQLAPGIFITFFGVIVYHMLIEKKLQFSKKSLMILFIGAAAAIVCALIGYQMIFASRGIEIFKQLKEGSMNTNALELLVLSPFVIMVMAEVKRRKEKWNVFHIGLFVYMGMQLVMTCMAGAGLISTYYLFKTYIILWFLVFAILAQKGGYIGEKGKKYLGIYLLGVFCFLTLSYNGKESGPVSVKNSIYMQNIDVFVNTDFSAGYMSDNGKLYLFQYAMEEIGEEVPTVPLVVTNERVGAGSWYCGLYRRGSYLVRPTWTEEEFRSVLQTIDAKYFIVFYDDLIYRELLHDHLETYEKVFENENGFIAKYN